MATVALSTKAAGSVVKLKFNGAMREFVVVHQGRPSSLCDESCNGTSGTMNSDANGLSAKIFLTSDREAGFTKSNIGKYICDDGAKLGYFTDGNGTSEKIAKYNGSVVHWWLRSP